MLVLVGFCALILVWGVLIVVITKPLLQIVMTILVIGLVNAAFAASSPKNIFNLYKLDLSSQLTESPPENSLTLYGKIVFRIEGNPYAEDEGLIVLLPGALVFDGRQTTFSLPLNQSRVTFGTEGELIILYPFLKVDLLLPRSAIFDNSRNKEFNSWLAQLQNRGIDPNSDFGPPLESQPHLVRTSAKRVAVLNLSFALGTVTVLLRGLLLGVLEGIPMMMFGLFCGALTLILLPISISLRKTATRTERLIVEAKRDRSSLLTRQWSNSTARREWEASIEEERQKPPAQIELVDLR